MLQTYAGRGPLDLDATSTVFALVGVVLLVTCAFIA